MHAAILSIGDELTLGQTLDTNSRWLSDQLAARSILVREHRTVADDRSTIARAVADLAERHDLLIITGGLGPTTDDLTREALSDALGEPLVQDDDAPMWLDEWFTKRGRRMPEGNLRQTYRPRTMRCIPNPHGTAPGLTGMLGQCTIFALPGPPPEMMPMFLAHVAPNLPVDPESRALITGKVNLFGLGESLAAERIADLMARDRTPLVGITISESIVSARVRALGSPDEVRSKVEADLQIIEERWHPYAFGREEETLAQAIAKLLKSNGATLTTAESCTGGWLGKAIVDVAGSSAYYLGGWVTYSNEMKVSQLGVDPALIETHGAVSSETAQSMAEGARQRSGADYALAITGVAGPDGTNEKPAGLVFIALARSGHTASVRRFNFVGDRSAVRDRSVKAALQMLRFAIIGVSESERLLWQSGVHDALGIT